MQEGIDFDRDNTSGHARQRFGQHSTPRTDFEYGIFVPEFSQRNNLTNDVGINQKVQEETIETALISLHRADQNRF